MIAVFKRVSDWNAARYDQIYNQQLTLSLLREEYQEYLEATTEVDKLDALCDLAYVAMGALWKLNPSDAVQADNGEHSVKVVAGLIEINELSPVFLVGTYLDVLQYTDGYPDVQTMHFIITSCLTEISGLGVDPVAAMSIVCDSNDTKSVAKTASDVKANKDKGEHFRPPEYRLQSLLGARKDA